MNAFILRFLVAALGLWVATEIVTGLHVASLGTLLIAALLLGVVNAVVRPVLILLTLPLTLVTLGLFLFVVNAAMLGLVALVLPGFTITGFWPALLSSIVISLVSWIASAFVGPRLRAERWPRGR